MTCNGHQKGISEEIRPVDDDIAAELVTRGALDVRASSKVMLIIHRSVDCTWSARDMTAMKNVGSLPAYVRAWILFRALTW